MSGKKLKVVVTRRLPDPVETRLRELFDAELNVEDKPFTAEELGRSGRARRRAGADRDRPDRWPGAFARGRSAAPDRPIRRGRGQYRCRTAVQRGITVTNTPGVLTEDTADMTMALILAVPRRIVEGVKIVRADEFQGWSPTWMLGRRIWGKRLGIIGMGRIGQAVARRAKAFGLQIHYHNRRRVAAHIEARA
jgi:glyoxylate reductase